MIAYVQGTTTHHMRVSNYYVSIRSYDDIDDTRLCLLFSHSQFAHASTNDNTYRVKSIEVNTNF